MNKLFLKNRSLIFFVSIPIIFCWHPNWLGLFGIQPYWPLFLLLPWSMVNGSSYGFIFGLFLGLILDALTLESSFTQIPGLMLCGVLFGRIKVNRDNLVEHFRYGLICSFGSFFCGAMIFLQILVKNFSFSNFSLFLPSIKNILAEIFLTGLFAPLICSQLFKLFKLSRIKAKELFM